MDIISLPVEYDNKKIDSKFRLVTIASQRAKELSLGLKRKIQTNSTKVATIAIEEAINPNSHLEFLTGEEARVAKEDAGKLDYRKLIEESRKLAAGEELSELEKDLKVYLNGRETTNRERFDEIFSEKKRENPKE